MRGVAGGRWQLVGLVVLVRVVVEACPATTVTRVRTARSSALRRGRRRRGEDNSGAVPGAQRPDRAALENVKKVFHHPQWTVDTASQWTQRTFTPWPAAQVS